MPTGAHPRTVLLFAKEPRPGRAKTRLAPVLGEEEAARLYEAMLADTVERLHGVEAHLELWVAADREGAAWFRNRYPSLPIHRQEGEDLGARLAGAFDERFRRGDGAVMAVGSDHPTLPPTFVRRGFSALSSWDVILGPGRDGGYYALGIRGHAWPAARALFREIPWSSPRVAAATRNAASAAGLTLGELPEWYDVDRPEDLDLLRRDASPGSRSLRALDRLTGGAGSGGRREEGGS